MTHADPHVILNSKLNWNILSWQTRHNRSLQDSLQLMRLFMSLSLSVRSITWQGCRVIELSELMVQLSITCFYCCCVKSDGACSPDRLAHDPEEDLRPGTQLCTTDHRSHHQPHSAAIHGVSEHLLQFIFFSLHLYMYHHKVKFINFITYQQMISFHYLADPCVKWSFCSATPLEFHRFQPVIRER